MASPDTDGPLRWYHSLVIRTMALCGVLVACLLGAVYVLTRHYVHELATELEGQTREVAQSVEVLLEENPGEEVSALNERFKDRGVRFDELGDIFTPAHVTLEPRKDGGTDLVARMTISHGGRRILQTVRVALGPQAAILRAFSNRYMALVTVVFLIALGLMVYVIARVLGPLRELSESCARISEGQLTTVAVRRNAGEILALERTFNHMVSALREKEQVEANLRRAQRVSALGSLAAGIAHDVRNPLNAIKLLASHALDTVGGGPGARQLQTIRKEVDRLEDIVSGFLSLAKEHELRPEPCRLDDILTEVAHLVREDAQTRGVRLIVDLRAGETVLMLDRHQFARAVLNVVLNALEASPRDGRVRLFSRVTGTACAVEVRDDGPGLAPEAVDRAFDPYFTTKPTGTGLGLSITRGIVEEHGGTVTLTGTEGQGCQVLITLPLDTPKVSAV